jgi:hypothetical protein
MPKYFTNHTASEEFDSDKEAWEALRKLSPGRYTMLYKKVAVRLDINNERWYSYHHEKKYGTSYYSARKKKRVFKPSLDYKDKTRTIDIPIMEGITDHKWSFRVDNLPVTLFGLGDRVILEGPLPPERPAVRRKKGVKPRAKTKTQLSASPSRRRTDDER